MRLPLFALALAGCLSSGTNPGGPNDTGPTMHGGAVDPTPYLGGWIYGSGSTTTTCGSMTSTGMLNGSFAVTKVGASEIATGSPCMQHFRVVAGEAELDGSQVCTSSSSAGTINQDVTAGVMRLEGATLIYDLTAQLTLTTPSGTTTHCMYVMNATAHR
jgi:hypothetical protein